MGETFPHRPICYSCSGDPPGTSHHDCLLQRSQPAAPIHTNPLYTLLISQAPESLTAPVTPTTLLPISLSLFFFFSDSILAFLYPHRAYQQHPPPTPSQQSLHEILNFSKHSKTQMCQNAHPLSVLPIKKLGPEPGSPLYDSAQPL